LTKLPRRSVPLRRFKLLLWPVFETFFFAADRIVALDCVLINGLTGPLAMKDCGYIWSMTYEPTNVPSYRRIISRDNVLAGAHVRQVFLQHTVTGVLCTASLFILWQSESMSENEPDMQISLLDLEDGNLDYHRRHRPTASLNRHRRRERRRFGPARSRPLLGTVEKKEKRKGKVKRLFL
jgi:hypothetical protein